MMVLSVVMKMLFWLSAATIIYVYAGYYLILKAVSAFSGYKLAPGTDFAPGISVIIAAHNEGGVIADRLDDILAQGYPEDRLEVIVASDGSTDDTVAAAYRYKDKGVVVLDFRENRGRALTHNDAVEHASGEVLVFTDAETRFGEGFLKNLLFHYADPAVGCVSGRVYLRGSSTDISGSESIYLKYELALRRIEEKLGMLATGSGPCFSVRKKLFRPLTAIDDVDFSIPIDCVKAGYLVRQEMEARAYDYLPADPASEIRLRARMTSKNFLGTVRRCGKGFYTKFPMIGLGLISHKFLRWFTGYFMAVALLSNLALLGEGPVYKIAFAVQAIFYALCLAGYLGRVLGRNLPIVAQIFSFTLAAYGMSIGIFNSLTGRVPVKWGKQANNL